jgi:hypothetical protein
MLDWKLHLANPVQEHRSSLGRVADGSPRRATDVPIHRAVPWFSGSAPASPEIWTANGLALTT